MKKEFNTEGNCNPEKHYMVDISGKLEKIFPLIEKGKYFAINRPRQYGKTTILSSLVKYLMNKEGYLPIRISFEGIGSDSYRDEKSFTQAFCSRLRKHFLIKKSPDLADLVDQALDLPSLIRLDDWITEFVIKSGKKVVLMIDEVDKSSNNQLFLDFLGMLRSKYLSQNDGEDHSFHSVILAGLYDVKSLKLKLRPNDEAKLNSPWNIAADFNVEMSFQPKEIASMLDDYGKENQVEVDILPMAEKLYYYISGYPFLVSKLCKIMDEQLMGEKGEWDENLLENAVQQLLKEKNTNFESLIKNLENNSDLSNLVESIILDGTQIEFSEDNVLVNLGVLHGILRNNGHVKIHNRIFEQRIYKYLSINLQVQQLIENKISNISNYAIQEDLLKPDGNLDFEKVLKKFQEFMKSQYSEKDKGFLERNGRLLFLSFLRPILNGKGFDFKEVQTSEEKRLDVVVTFMNHKFVIELKIWRGQKEHEKGLQQLSDYLDRWNLNQGYLLIFDLRMEKNREWETKKEKVNEKEILAVWV